jgi:hypothetical protein
MALQISGAAQLKLYYGAAGNLAINVMGAVVNGTPVFDQALADSLGAAIKSAWTANLATHMGTNVSLVRVGIRNLQQANLPEFRDSGAAVSGTAVGDTLPVQTALCITLRTAQAGKSFRGRVYLPGWAEADNNATGVASSAAATAGVSFVNAVHAALSTHAMGLGVLSYPSLDKVIQEITTHADGSTTTRRLSHQTAKTGRVSAVVNLESRTAAWETIRRRANGRGVPPALVTVVASQPIGG